MRVQQIDNKQSFQMAWKTNLVGMAAEEIKPITNNTKLLDKTFENMYVKISKVFFSSKSFADTAYPANRFGLWLVEGQKHTTRYIFDSKEAPKSFLGKVKSLLGYGIKIRTKSENIEGISDENKLNAIFEATITKAKNDYLSDSRVIVKQEKIEQKIVAKNEAEKRNAEIMALKAKRKK